MPEMILHFTSPRVRSGGRFVKLEPMQNLLAQQSFFLV